MRVSGDVLATIDHFVYSLWKHLPKQVTSTAQNYYNGGTKRLPCWSMFRESTLQVASNFSEVNFRAFQKYCRRKESLISFTQLVWSSGKEWQIQNST